MTFSEVVDGIEVLHPPYTGFEPLVKALGRAPTPKEANEWRDQMQSDVYARWQPIIEFAYWCIENYSAREAPKVFWQCLNDGEIPALTLEQAEKRKSKEKNKEGRVPLLPWADGAPIAIPITPNMMRALWKYFGGGTP